MLLRTGGLGVILLALGCTSPSWDEPGPRETYEAFLMSGFRGDRQALFEAIAPEDREVLTASLKNLGSLPESARPEPWEMLVVAGLDNPYDIARTSLREKLESEPVVDARVVVDVTYTDGRTGQVVMLWGGERWFVDLPLEGAQAETVEEDEG